MRANWPAFLVWLAAGLGLASGAAAATPDLADIDLDQEREAIRDFQDADQFLQDVGWALVRGNAPFCEQIIPAIGLQLQDLASYGRPDIARAALQLDGDFAVQTIARGSPADQSNAFMRNREIVRIGEADPNTWPAGDSMDWERWTRAQDAIDAALIADRSVKLGFADGTSARLRPVPVCATRFELLGNSGTAVADGARVVIGRRFPAFAYEEKVFAGVVAHELAHNLLGHTAWLDRNGRGRSKVRLTEREADRLMPWLLANAGYDPQGAYLFMTRWGKRHGLGIFRKRTHDGWDERAEFIAAEIPIIEDLMKREGKADWSVHFRREIDPDLGLTPEAILARAEAVKASRAAFARIELDASALDPVDATASAVGTQSNTQTSARTALSGQFNAKVSARLCEMVYITALWRSTSPLNPALARACWLSSLHPSLPIRTRLSGSSS